MALVMSMELLQLRYFLESAETENFSKVAEKYHVPPSGVSVAVKKLERELNCTLFTRSNNKIRLNDRGRRLREALRRAFDEIDAAVADVAAHPADEEEEVSLLIRCERRIVGEHLLAFKERNPQVKFRLSHEFGTHDEVRYDVIVDTFSERYNGFDRFPMLSEPMRFVAAVGHPLCGKRLTLGDLSEQRFVTLAKGSSLRSILDEVCATAGFRPHIVIESDDPYYVRKYIEMGLGIALIPERTWEGEFAGEVAFLDVIDLRRERVTYAFLNKTCPHASAAARFYRFLAEREVLK